MKNCKLNIFSTDKDIVTICTMYWRVKDIKKKSFTHSIREISKKFEITSTKIYSILEKNCQFIPDVDIKCHYCQTIKKIKSRDEIIGIKKIEELKEYYMCHNCVKERNDIINKQIKENKVTLNNVIKNLPKVTKTNLDNLTIAQLIHLYTFQTSIDFYDLSLYNEYNYAHTIKVIKDLYINGLIKIIDFKKSTYLNRAIKSVDVLDKNVDKFIENELLILHKIDKNIDEDIFIKQNPKYQKIKKGLFIDLKKCKFSCVYDESDSVLLYSDIIEDEIKNRPLTKINEKEIVSLIQHYTVVSLVKIIDDSIFYTDNSHCSIYDKNCFNDGERIYYKENIIKLYELLTNLIKKYYFSDLKTLIKENISEYNMIDRPFDEFLFILDNPLSNLSMMQELKYEKYYIKHGVNKIISDLSLLHKI